MATRNPKRSSILKKRPSLASGSSNESSPTQSLPKISKKIFFSVKNNVKEFTTQDERNTIWINSYEESAERHSGTHSLDENSTHSFVPQHQTISNSMVVSEHDKENVILPQKRHISNMFRHSSIDLSFSMTDREASFLQRVQNLTTQDDTINLSHFERVEKLKNEKTIQAEDDDMELTAVNVFENVEQRAEPTRSPRKTIYFHEQANLSISIEDSVKLSTAPPTSERVIFRSKPIANRFPGSFTRRVNQFVEDDMSFGSFFAPDKPVTVPPMEDTSAKCVSQLDNDISLENQVVLCSDQQIIMKESKSVNPNTNEESIMSIVDQFSCAPQNDCQQNSNPTRSVQILNEDIDISILPEPKNETESKTKDRKTIYFLNDDMDIESLKGADVTTTACPTITKTSNESESKLKGRKTKYFLNEDIDLESLNGDDVSTSRCPPKTNNSNILASRKETETNMKGRNTIYFLNDNMVIEHLKSADVTTTACPPITKTSNEFESNTKGRKTKYFLNEDMDIESLKGDDVATNECPLIKNNVLASRKETESNLKGRNTIYFLNDDIEVENNCNAVNLSVRIQEEPNQDPVEKEDRYLPAVCKETRKTVYDANIEISNLNSPIQLTTDSTSVMEIEAFDEGDRDNGRQRTSARRTIMFDDNACELVNESENFSILQPLPNMSVVNVATTFLPDKSDVEIVPQPSRKTIYFNNDSMEQSTNTIVVEEDKTLFTTDITIDTCRAAPFQDGERKSLRFQDATIDGEQTFDKHSALKATPSKIPIAKHRLTVSEKPDCRLSKIENIPEMLLENESDPCVDPPEAEQRSSTNSSRQSSNFELFRERYLNLTMPRFSNANQPIPLASPVVNKKDTPRQSFGSMTNLLNFSTRSSECSAILNEIKEKISNYGQAISDGTNSNVTVTDKNKIAIDFSKYGRMIADMNSRRVPIDQLADEMREKIKNLELIVNSKPEEAAQKDKLEKSNEYIGAIFPVAPSFTSIWQNLWKSKSERPEEIESEIIAIHPLAKPFIFLLKNKISTELKSWVLDDAFFHSGILELHNKLLKTIKLRVFCNQPEDDALISIKYARFMQNSYASLTSKSVRFKLVHLEFLFGHPYDTPPVITINELGIFLETLQQEIKAIYLKVNRLFEICECFDVEIVETPLQVKLLKEFGYQSCEVSLLNSGGLSNLKELSRENIKLCPEMPQIMKTLEKYTGFELLEVLFFELGRTMYPVIDNSY